MVVVYASAGALKITPVNPTRGVSVGVGGSTRGCQFGFCYNVFDAFVTVCSSRGGHSLSDQIHLRLSCPPFC